MEVDHLEINIGNSEKDVSSENDGFIEESSLVGVWEVNLIAGVVVFVDA
jgi:hypothetical protein